MSLFKKAAVCTDLHIGAKSNSVTHNEDCIEFLKWFTKTAIDNNCDTCLFLGDYHNNRSTMNIRSMNYTVRGLEILSKNFSKIYFIPGNHDLFFKEKRDIHSVEWAKHIPNITIINDWFNEGDVVIAPWLVEQDYKKLKKLKGKYIFGHFELPGFLLNSMIKMPDHGDINDSHFEKFDHCFSGHFHKRQTNKNITYIGNCFPLNFSDAWDDDRGMMILEWDKDPTFISWPNQPTYRTIALSKLIEQADEILKPKQHIKVNIDIDVSYEEITYIKENFIQLYNLRELLLIQDKSINNIEIDETDIAVDSIDNVIHHQINSIDSEKYDTNLLTSIYNDL